MHEYINNKMFKFISTLVTKFDFKKSKPFFNPWKWSLFTSQQPEKLTFLHQILKKY